MVEIGDKAVDMNGRISNVLGSQAVTKAGDTQSRKLYKKLAQLSCTRNLHQIWTQVSRTKQFSKPKFSKLIPQMAPQ